MDQNLVGSIYGKSSVEIAQFVPIFIREIDQPETRIAYGSHV
jgi:hypothetical protein